MEKNMLIASAILSILSLSLAGAQDLAYIYSSSNKIDAQLTDIFSEFNFSVYYINEDTIWYTNFSNYDLVFIGDEQFNRDFNIENYPSIIMNYYIGPETGLTDADGISKLTAAQPLRAGINGSYIQVYTAAINNYNEQLSYYYLADLNVAQDMEKYLGTYDSSSGADLGDVISFGRAGDYLANGKKLNESVCFFGLKDIKYWTENARRLFEDCVSFVAHRQIERKILCNNNNDCSDGDSFTEDVCINPGEYNSICANKPYIFATVGNLTASATENSITLNLTINLGNSTGVKGIDFGINKTNWTTVKTNSSVYSYTFDSLNANTEYVFYVRVIDSQNRTSPEASLKIKTFEQQTQSGGNNGGGGSGGGGGGSPQLPGNITNNLTTANIPCNSRWNCTEWGQCENGYQVRTCTVSGGDCLPNESWPEQAKSCKNSSAENPENIQNLGFFSKITGAAIGAGGIRSPLLWVLIFLAIVVILYIWTRKETGKGEENKTEESEKSEENIQQNQEEKVKDKKKKKS